MRSDEHGREQQDGVAQIKWRAAPPALDGEHEHGDCADHIESESNTRPGQQERQEGAQGMSLVEARFEQWGDLGNSAQSLQIAPHYRGSIMCPGQTHSLRSFWSLLLP